MSPEHSHSPPSSRPPSTQRAEPQKSRSVMIARIVGIFCVAGGFVLGIQGLDQPNSPLLSMALGLIVIGMVAQVFALVRSWYLHSHRNI